MVGHTLQKLTRIHKVADALEVYKSEELTVLLKCKSERMGLGVLSSESKALGL